MLSSDDHLDKKLFAKVLSICLAFLLIGSCIGYVVAQSTNNFMTFTGGQFPGAADYTISSEAGVAYAKNQYGAISKASSDITSVFQYVADAGGTVRISQGDYVLNTVTLDQNVKFEVSGNVRLFPSGNTPVFIINLNDAWTWKTAQGYKTADIELNGITFVGSRVTDASTAFIEVQHTSNIVNVNVQFDRLQFVDGKRGIWQNSSNVWYAMGCHWTNIRTLNMTGSSIITQCITDLMIDKVEIFNSDYETIEPNVVLNSVQAGQVYASGIVVNDLTVLGKNAGSVTHSVELHNKAAHLSNIEIDTCSGDGLYINGTYNTVTNYEVAGHAGNGIIVEGNWNSLSNGKIRENGKNGLEFTSGGYFQLKADFVNNGKSADNTYYDLKIDDGQGQNCIIDMTCNSAESNRPAYGAFLGSTSYGSINIVAAGARSGALTQHTSKLWDITARYNGLNYEQFGTFYVSAGLIGLKKEVPLNMAFAPSIVLLQGTTGASTSMSYDNSNITSTYFLINIPTNNTFNGSFHVKYIP